MIPELSEMGGLGHDLWICCTFQDYNVIQINLCYVPFQEDIALRSGHVSKVIPKSRCFYKIIDSKVS